MQEKEPLYITKLKEHIDDRLENHEPRYFIDFKKHIDERLENNEPKYFVEFKKHIDDKLENHEPRYFREFRAGQLAATAGAAARLAASSGRARTKWRSDINCPRQNRLMALR
jgi:hypothetical protein